MGRTFKNRKIAKVFFGSCRKRFRKVLETWSERIRNAFGRCRKMGDLTNEGAKNEGVSQWGSEKTLSSEVDLFKTIIFNKINHIQRKLPTNQRSFSWRFWRVMWPPNFFWKQNTRNFKDVHVSAENFNGGLNKNYTVMANRLRFFCIFPAIYTLLTFFLPRRQNRMYDTIFQVKALNIGHKNSMLLTKTHHISHTTTWPPQTSWEELTKVNDKIVSKTN